MRNNKADCRNEVGKMETIRGLLKTNSPQSYFVSQGLLRCWVFCFVGGFFVSLFFEVLSTLNITCTSSVSIPKWNVHSKFQVGVRSKPKTFILTSLKK